MLEGPAWVNGHYVPTMDEMMEYQSTREPWEESVKYGHYVLYFCGVVLGFFFLVRWIKVLIIWARVNGTPSVVSPKLIAVARLLFYPRLSYPAARIVNWIWTVGPLGPNILLLTTLVFTSLYCWINEYYYRPPFYGSPPVGLRSEWIAMALIPFVFVLGAKRNIISWITGTSHEKLQVVHQGAAFLLVYFSLVHTISMVVQSLSELPFAETYGSDYIWWTGFAALGALLWLYIGSLPFVRKYLYEVFYLLHIAASIMFIGFLWFHGTPYLDTDAYMKATIALFGFGIVARLAFMVVRNVFFRHRARLSLRGDFVAVSIPTKLSWSPGMHMFVRFLHIRPLESHPFTIASLPASSSSDGSSESNEMVFLVKPESGFTRVLAERAATASTTQLFPVIIDGPYGESGTSNLRAYNSVMLLAGGMGLTFIVPLLEDLARSMHEKVGVCKMVELVITAKSHDVIKAFDAQLLEAKNLAQAAGGTVNIHVHITSRSTGDEEAQLETPSLEKFASEDDADSTSLYLHPTFGRPDISSIIAAKSTTWTGHVAVAVCGPLSFLTSASNAVSKVQLDILRGRASCEEMHLRSETFGW